MKVSSLKDLRTDPKNARKHNPRNIGLIERSLRSVGAARSGVIDENGVILAGNGTYEALAAAGIEKVRVVEADGNEWVVVQRKGLTEHQKRELALADNRAAELAEWDGPSLAEQGIDLEPWFSTAELAKIDAGAATIGEDGPDPKFDKAEALREQYGVELGQIWGLGEHRLACGDSTEVACLDSLLDGVAVELMVTSPPYNQKIDQFRPSGMHKEGDWVAKVERLAYADSMPEPEYQDKQRIGLALWFDRMRDGSTAFYNHKNRYRDKKLISPLQWIPGPFNLRQEIVWSRPGSVTQNARMFLPSDERIYWMYKGDGFFFNDTTDVKSWSTVWRIGLETNKDHAVGFPVELPQRCIQACSRIGDSVFEPYSGSGTTLIACEQLGRRCYAMEISPAYVAVAIQRWVDLTGKEPRLL